MTFFEEETLLAIMTFNHHREMFESNILIVSHGVEPIDFGQIQFTGTKGRAALEPAYQNDQDGDGIVDFDDEDDDNDGTPDVDERDCDFDGFFYANDLDNSSCEAAGDIGDVPLQPGEDWILEVLPRNQAKFVSIDQPVKVRANCVVDPTSLSRAYFSVGDSKGGHITCNLSLSSSGREVICNHDNFLANMYHTATVEGLDCADHDGGIRSVTWHFTTAVPSD
ncbi:MAG: hypothetical protein HYT76_09320 [Deltaproteobacteria bacterium]|nr:hypothetical protein [Deltaproteobacteria bacterium]